MISNHTLAANANEQVIVTVSYAENAAIADGAFEIAFGDISLTYSTISNYVQEEIPTEEKVCTIERQNEGVYTVGDVVTCELEESTDKFYVIEDAGAEATYIQVLTEKNIDPTTYRQSSSAGPVVFSSTNYWSSETTYPVDVYDKGDNNLKPIVDNYVSYLNGTLIEDATGSLLTYSQATALGCDETVCTCGPDIVGAGALENPAPTWVYSTDYWLGSASDSRILYDVNSNGYFTNNGRYGISNEFGVRPVITISTDDLN